VGRFGRWIESVGLFYTSIGAARTVLRRKRRQDAGEQVSMTTPLRQALLAQYGAHKSWSAQLHHDNLVALAETRPELQPVCGQTNAELRCPQSLVRRCDQANRQRGRKHQLACHLFPLPPEGP
jgi:ABC-type antimicrobial peptide transport system ATPase subunit